MSNTFPHGYALLIGVGETADPELSLPVTVKDIQALKKALTDPSYCAYPNNEEHIRLLHDAEAARQNILDGLAWLKERAEADPDATMIVYYSGHGWLDPSKHYYLLPHDTNRDNLAHSALEASAFTDALHQIAAQRLLIVIDSCHAEGMAQAKDGQGHLSPTAFPDNLTKALAQGEGCAVFASSRGTQQSWTRPDEQMSIYTYHFIEALQGKGNQTGEKKVYISNLMNYLGDKVPESARVLHNQEQTPFFSMAADDFPVAICGKKWPSPKKKRNPFIHGNPVEPDKLIGRNKELREIARRIITGQSTIITGSPRSGKTSLLRYLRAPEAADYYGDDAGRLVFSYWDACACNDEFTQMQFWEKVLKPLKEHITDQQGQDSSLLKNYQTCEENQFESSEFEKLFVQIKQFNWKFVLIIDEFDSLLKHPKLNSSDFFGGLRVQTEASQGTLVLVLTANISRRRFHKKACHFTGGSPYFNFTDEIVLGALPETEIDELLHQGNNYFSESDYLFIKGLAGGHPYLLQVAASLLWEAYENGHVTEADKRQQQLKVDFYYKVEEILHNIWNIWSLDMQKAFSSVVQSQQKKRFPFPRKKFLQKHYKSEEWRELEKYGFLISSCSSCEESQLDNCRWQVYPGVFLSFHPK